MLLPMLIMQVHNIWEWGEGWNSYLLFAFLHRKDTEYSTINVIKGKIIYALKIKPVYIGRK